MLTTTELDDIDLVVTTMANHFSGNLGTVNNRSTHFNVVAVHYQQNAVKLNRAAGFNFQLFQLQSFAFFNTVLFTTANNNCVHSMSPRLTHPCSYPPGSKGSTSATL